MFIRKNCSFSCCRLHSGLDTVKWVISHFGIGLLYVRFEVFMAVTMKNVIFWNVTLRVRTTVSEECIASVIRVTGIGGLGTLAVISNQSTL
jgi:hypothetical protein